jgi:hypothetical protein
MGLNVITIVVAIIAVGFALRFLALVDALRKPATTWDRTPHGRRVWVLLILFVPFAGAGAYFFVARPALRTAA